MYLITISAVSLIQCDVGLHNYGGDRPSKVFMGNLMF